MNTAAPSLLINRQEERLIHTMQLLGDRTRFKIFKLLSENRNFCVSEIAGQLDVSVSAISQHFRSFELLGLVKKERMGQKICYGLKTDDSFVKLLITLTKET